MATTEHPRRDRVIAKHVWSFGVALLVGVSACGEVSTLVPDGGEGSMIDDGPSSIDAPACSQCGVNCVDLTTDLNNCGSCDTKCSAGQVCRGGQCACASGNQSLCGAGASAKCIDLMADLSNCGTCGNACAANTTCHAGKCVCPGTQTLCGAGVNMACTYLTNDPANCGKCGSACPPGANCLNGACACPTGQQMCGAICTDTTNDHANCGACGTPCASGSACVTGKCIPCTAMTTGKMCGTPPVCVDTSTDRGNCAMCGTVCLPSEICQGSQCACPTGETLCGSGSMQACVIFSSDQNNCGSCGNVCKGGSLCVGGACVCPAGYHRCSDSHGGTCVPDNSTSTSSCGTSCAVCSAPSGGGASCSGSPPACFQSCPGDHPDLCGSGGNTGCTNLTSDTGNCGSCGKQCNTNHAVPRCSNGNCSIASCISSFRDCDGNPWNGCETDTNWDPNNCGNCGHHCSTFNGSPSCQNGSCVIGSCNAPFVNCDHNPSSGCNVNTSNDVNNCGGCGHSCPSGASCNNGSCACPQGSIQCGNACVSCPARPLNGTLTCNGGSCVASCNNANLPNLCGNVCVNFQTDQGNCGGCNNPCVSNNKCDSTFTCQAGVCTGSNAKTCPPPDVCHGTGTCNPNDGTCGSYPTANDGKMCPPGADKCQQTYTCMTGVCTGSNAKSCPAPDVCHGMGTCNSTNGVCGGYPTANDGMMCTPGPNADKCAMTFTCAAGTCTGSNPKPCPVLDVCHDMGTCNSTTGVCAYQPANEGGMCPAGANKCKQTYTCQSGTCTGSNPVVCPPPPECHSSGTCDTTSGVCSDPPPLRDGTKCTGTATGMTCQGGSCQCPPGTSVCNGACMDTCPLPDAGI